MENIITLFDAAVAAIKESHETLKAKLTPIFIGYSSNILPPRPERASRILDCEANGAHKLLEDLASGAKAQARGELGDSTEELLKDCKKFLDFLADNLKSSDCEAAINDVRQTVGAFINLIRGDSGCDPSITKRQYNRRIDKFIRDLKKLFRDLGHNIVKYEFTLCERAKAETEKSQATITIDKKCEKKIKAIYNTVALGKEPSSSEIAAETRHQQILFGVTQYKPRSKYSKGVSFMLAAKLAISAPQFKNIEGSYKLNEIKSLARAIGREYKNPKLDNAT